MSEIDSHKSAPASDRIIDGRYRLLRLIGIGGMGAVYEAEHVAIGRRVAIKILHSQFSQHADLVERLRREAQAASRIGHPNIVDVTDFGRTEDSSAYLAMEFLHGTDLGAILRERGQLPEARALGIGLQTVQALAAAHRVGIVHRDLKPENIFIVNPADWPSGSSQKRRTPNSMDALAERMMSLSGPRSGPLLVPRSGAPSSIPVMQDLVKVLDFGIAVQLGSTPLHEPPLALQHTHRSARLTNPGLTVGTPEYMAPEQAMGSAVDARADIYAVGTLLYETVCGRVPFVAPSVPELLTMKTDQPAPPPRVFAPAMSIELEVLILRCLERDPAQRPQTMEEVEEALLLLVSPSLPSATSSPGELIERKSSPALLDPVQAVSSEFLGRVAVPTPSSTSPSPASSAELSAQDATKAPLPPRYSPEMRGLLAVLGAAALVTVGFASARYVIRHTGLNSSTPSSAVQTSAPNLPARTGQSITAPAAMPPAAQSVPGLMSHREAAPRWVETPEPASEEVKMLLEWARRAAAGRRFTAPPGDNLRELLARITVLSKHNVEAGKLRQDTISALSRRLHDELRRRHTLDALESFRALRALDPLHHVEAARKDLLYQLLFLARTSRRGTGAYSGTGANSGDSLSLLAAHGAVELAPASAAAHLALADALLASGKREAAMSSYRHVLELGPRPTERRLAEQGLLRLGNATPIAKRRAAAARPR